MPNQLKTDPTRTTMLRRKFMADMTRRFKRLSKAIQVLIVDDDALGLEGPATLQERQVWRFRTNAQKVKAYRRWLQQQVDTGILSPVGGISGKPWTAPYIESAYKKGGLRAYTDLRAEELANHPSLFEGGQAEFMRTAFGQPEALHKIELLYERTFDELKGVTDVMGQQMSRTLAEGLSQGHGTKKIARALRANVSKITKTRAHVIARTEIIRAHAEGQLDAFEVLGVEEVGVMAEWNVAGDERVCSLCNDLDGVIMTVEEARGLMPRHPNCRCAWIPANKARREKGQLWGAEKDRAIERSIQAEAPKIIKRTAKEVKRRSTWVGKELSKKALKGVRREVTPSLGKLPSVKASTNLAEAESNLKSVYRHQHNFKRQILVDVKGINDDLAKEALDEVSRLMQSHPTIINKIRIYDMKMENVFMAFDASTQELVINKSVFKSRKIFDRIMRKRRLEGILPRNLREVIVHEYGHAFESNLPFNAQMDIGTEFFRTGSSVIKKQISLYASSNEAEMFAEAFVQWQKGQASVLSKKLLKIAKLKKIGKKIIPKVKPKPKLKPVKKEVVIREKLYDTYSKDWKAEFKKNMDAGVVDRGRREYLYGKNLGWSKEQMNYYDSLLEAYNKKVGKYTMLGNWEQTLTQSEFRALQFYQVSFDNVSAIRYLQTGINPLRVIDTAIIERAKRILPRLERLMKRAPNYKGTLYRGMRLGPGDMAKFTNKGAEITFDSITSSSGIKKETENFLKTFVSKEFDSGKLPIILDIETNLGIKLGRASQAPGWDEILISKGTKFKVVDVTKKQSKLIGEHLYVSLKQI